MREQEQEDSIVEQRRTRISFELHSSLLIEDDILMEMEDGDLDDDLLDDLF